jgi:molybdate transport system permease protein
VKQRRGRSPVPVLLALPAALALVFLLLPLLGLLVRAPWRDAATVLSSAEALHALRL